ncbi:hypothetical protein [Photobacterium sanguinicancri]|uniref:hypothetical protein n=1 Tax=Photobacterium sanguinicancri TaxID=875932 RepID=UPI000B23DA41|nr:hypothetical protein [Photobacterium sanguinicancri]
MSDYIHVSGSAFVENKTVFGDYFISHDGYTQSLIEMDAIHMLKDRRTSQPLLSHHQGQGVLFSQKPEEVTVTK